MTQFLIGAFLLGAVVASVPYFFLLAEKKHKTRFRKVGVKMSSLDRDTKDIFEKTITEYAIYKGQITVGKKSYDGWLVPQDVACYNKLEIDFAVIGEVTGSDILIKQLGDKHFVMLVSK